MGLIFLVLFAAAEITLVVLTFTKFGEKAAWLKNRAIIRAVEAALLLGIILVPAVNMKWRFFLAMAFVAVRFLFDGISWLVRRGKISGMKKKIPSVFNCVFSVIFTGVALVPSFLFTNYNGLETTGEFKVKETSAILVDESRTDEFENDGSFREVPAHFYYPDAETGVYPLIVFSHGAFGYYQSNYSTYAELASNGYVVVALDHPHHSFFTKDTSGKMITVDEGFINDAMSTDGSLSNDELFNLSQSWLELRVEDENFVLDTIKEAKSGNSLTEAWHAEDKETILKVLAKTDTGKIGLMGHSLGGASSVALGRERKDIGAVIDLDGTMIGEVTGVKDGKCVYDTKAYPIPVLAAYTENNNNEIDSESDGDYLFVNKYMIDNAANGKRISFKSAGHMDFTDLPLISPSLAKMLGSGDVDKEEMLNSLNGVVLNWFNYYLKNEGTLNIQDKY
ncbi:MAG: dienelactone hydrolase family protein [Ruminococcus sp.]|nr:dienelactone hydrolase family protein [Ruminococcus sp.]